MATEHYDAIVIGAGQGGVPLGPALAQSGHTIEFAPRNRPDGARQMYLRDPDGHLVELYSRAS